MGATGTPDEDGAREPPGSLLGRIKHLGPSFVVTAATIGSGELIATTAAGARAGIVALWFLLVSIIVKSGIQYQFSKYGILADKTPHQMFDEFPGEILDHSWVWWLISIFWLVIHTTILMGVFFGMGLLLHYLTFQTIPVSITLIISLALTILPVLRGYDFVESFSIVIVGGLTLITLISVILITQTPYALSAAEIASGLAFNLPSAGITTFLGTLGVVGVAAAELIAYAIYVRESSFGSFAGRSGSEGWNERMNGWLRVLRLDVIVSLLIAVITTASFYILGATILAAQGNYPEGTELALYLANAYSQLFGPFGYWLLIVGGFFTLYSTAYGHAQIVAVAWPDWIKTTNWGKNIDKEKISTTVTIVLPIVWYIGGFATGLITPLIIYSGIGFTLIYLPIILVVALTLYRQESIPDTLKTTGFTKIGVWICIIITALTISAITLLRLI